MFRNFIKFPNAASLRNATSYTLKTDTENNQVAFRFAKSDISFYLKSSDRPISNIQLNALLHLHLCPIYLVVYKGSYSEEWISHLEGGFTLRCLQRLSLPDLATLP